VEQLAARADVSVDTVRFYQSRGLLPAPRREGRVAWYDDEHLERLARIRRMQARGLTLATIRRLLSGELDAADEALVTAVSTVSNDGGPEETFTIEELAERSGIPLGLLQAVARESLLVARRVGGEDRYSAADVDAAASGLRLLEAGLPLPEILDLAREHHAAMRAVAERAVELFDAHVRHPLRESGVPDDEAAARLVAAFTTLLPATTDLVTHHFRRTLLAVALEHIERVGGDAELAAVNAEAARTR
jgi:DNA-binding transcriptional MerR regulator